MTFTLEPTDAAPPSVPGGGGHGEPPQIRPPAPLTIRIDAVQGGRRDDGHLVLAQGAPLAEELLAGAVDLGGTGTLALGNTTPTPPASASPGEGFFWGGGTRLLTMALHQRHRQSCSLRTLPQARSQTAQRALTGRLPSSHWWGMATCGEGEGVTRVPPPGEGGRATRDPPRAHPVLVLDDFRADGGQRGPLAVVGGAHGAALVGLELAHLGGRGGRVRTVPSPTAAGIAPYPPPGC